MKIARTPDLTIAHATSIRRLYNKVAHQPKLYVIISAKQETDGSYRSLYMSGTIKIISRIESIITELKRVQSLPSSHRDPDDDFPFPRLIDAGNGGSIAVSQKIDAEISEIAKALLQLDPSLKRKSTVNEWKASVRRYFGPALAEVDLAGNHRENAESVFSKIQSGLKDHVLGYGDREFCFGCTMLRDTPIETLCIGPVRIEQRSDWLTRKCAEGAVSKVTYRRLQESWSGKVLRKRKPSYDSEHETGILESIGVAPFVCAVRTEGLAPEAAKERALIVARLALTSIAMIWSRPSRILEGMNLLHDRRVYLQRVLVFRPGKVVLPGVNLSHPLGGPWLPEGELEKEIAQRESYFAIVGDVLTFLLDENGNAVRPKMMNTISQSLLWFHEAVREQVTLMAIVKYSAALDALACGGKTNGIRRLINARLGIPDDQPIRSGGPTLRNAVTQIYSYGRSRTIHGTSEKLGRDWSETKSLAEEFSRLCLLACIDWTASHPDSDDPTMLTK